MSDVTGQKPMAASTAATARPPYSAAVTLPPSFTRTNHVPMIDAMMDTPPSSSG